MIARPCRVGDCHFSVRVEDAVTASGRDHDRIVIFRAEDLDRRVDHADIDEPAGAKLEFQESFAISTQRHLIVSSNDHVPEIRRRQILLRDRLEVEPRRGFPWDLRSDYPARAGPRPSDRPTSTAWKCFALKLARQDG